MARHAFSTFIPLSVDSDARKQIILEFFDVLAAIAARAKTNGLGARKLSRLAGWWAFDHTDSGTGFDGGYRSWIRYASSCQDVFQNLAGLTDSSVLPMRQATCFSLTSARCPQAQPQVVYRLCQGHWKRLCRRPSTHLNCLRSCALPQRKSS